MVLNVDPKKRGFIIAILRRGTYRWHSRYKALKAANIGRNEYVCAECGQVLPKKKIQLDHVSPCVPVEGWDSWDGYIDRMYPDTPEGYQVLCKDLCHKSKTLLEVQARKINKK